MTSKKIRLITLCAAALLAGCAGSGEGLDENGRPLGEAPADPDGEIEPTIDSIQEHVFTPICAQCHSGTLPAQGLSLEDAQTSYDNLVNVRSTQVPTLFRVEPGNSDSSYLIHKLEGRPGISGDRMPRGQPPLSDETIAVIREWIDQGAAPPGTDPEALFLPPLP